MTRAAILVEQNWNAVPGGTARSTNSLVDALRAHTDTTLVGLCGTHRGDPVLDLPVGLDTVTLPIPGRLLIHSWDRFARPKVDRWVDVDVVHAPAYVLAPTASPVVVTIHDLAFVRHPEWFTSHGAAFFERFLVRVVKSEAAVIVPSSITADDCAAAGIVEDRISVIPWGISASPVSEERQDDARARHGLPDDFILYVGTLEPRKNLHTLAAAMGRLDRPEPLVVIGPDGWGDIRLPGARLLGELPSNDVAALMAAASVLVYPSHFEGFGLPVLEAMAQGTPVVVTEGTAPAEIARQAGLAVDTRNADGLAQAIESLLDDEEARGVMAEVGRRRARSYDWKRAAMATAEVYAAVSR